ncbi:MULTISPECIES: DUF6264 family protein [unclassified Cryobacterium]|uniref:DUF6264 family protein n=3 Tax=Cryobacterium TaxID=69578 RepID=UPI00106D312F|nr:MULTISPECIES: DUF6264 family protein [unclassified Cryobacterium]MDY7527014.1 DUF6264 family protein [Cryobacterium sp. 10C2]MDY7557191.1 DUF6264 family protein [Cryobacterium sp. 10C3]MEB0287641.1 DUF6264 family protein [Cryobacterium sp. 10S3]TFC00028.1 hypothetical protein E3O39_02470 [Cryobacterium sp. MDB2-A-1]TFC08047.1 hypothetical protein E3O59_08845 [Cryobacterium sp. MDB2-33-2]
MPSENVPDSPRRDPRPQPRYGELAPEGWSWDPGVTTPRSPTAGPNSAVSAPSLGTLTGPARPDVPAWDRRVTLGLLALGLAATFMSIGVLNALPDAIQMLYTQSHLGTYVPDSSVAGLVTAGGITEAIVWLLTAAAAILLISRRKRAFYVPVIGAVIALVVIFAFMMVVVTTDPTLIDFYSQP